MAMYESGLSIAGERQSGQDIRQSNVTAVAAVANILKTSLGPQGLDKMLVDDIGDITITNDGATIVKMLEVEHPAAKVLVELANLQDTEVGDGTTSVIIIASELIKRANDLVKADIHPTSIISGYRTAMRLSVKYIQEHLAQKVDALPAETLFQVARTSLSSKFIGQDAQTFATMVVDAVKSVKIVGVDGKPKYPIGQINVIKSHGKSSAESKLILNGYAVQLARAAQGMPTKVSPAKIAMIDFDLKKHRMHMGVNIVVDDPAELEKIRQKEMDITKEKIDKIIKAGANVVLTTKGIDDMAMKYLVEAGIIGVRRVNKGDMKRIAKCTGGAMQLTMATLDGEEAFEESYLGHADEFVEERVGDNDFCFVKGSKSSKATTILLRGANEFMLEEMDRSVHDSICAVSRTLESNNVVPGGGAVEAALNIHLEDKARTLGSREQLAVAEFAEALLTIPKTLAINAAKDAIDLTARLRAHHHASQTKAEQKDYKWFGLDLVNGKVRNCLSDGVLEPMVSKLKSLKFATEAAITILRIDDLIKLEEEQQPQR